MKYCPNCRQSYSDEANFCIGCGYNFFNQPIKKSNNGLETTAKVFLIIGAIITSLMMLFIPLAWCIPMSIIAYRRINRRQPISTEFKVCILLFVSAISGILLLCRNENNSCDCAGLAEQAQNDISADENVPELTGHAKIIAKLSKPLTLVYRIALPLLGILCIVPYVFSIVGAANYYGGTYLTVLFSSISLVLYFALIIVYLCKKGKFTTPVTVLNCILILSSILLLLCAIGSNVGAVYDEYYSNYYGMYMYRYGDLWVYWVVMGVGIGQFWLSLVTSIISIFYRQKNNAVTASTTASANQSCPRKSNVETELTEAKRLFDNQIITNEEYQRIRNSIISKYYK